MLWSVPEVSDASPKGRASSQESSNCARIARCGRCGDYPSKHFLKFNGLTWGQPVLLFGQRKGNGMNVVSLLNGHVSYGDPCTGEGDRLRNIRLAFPKRGLEISIALSEMSYSSPDYEYVEVAIMFCDQFVTRNFWFREFGEILHDDVTTIPANKIFELIAKVEKAENGPYTFRTLPSFYYDEK